MRRSIRILPFCLFIMLAAVCRGQSGAKIGVPKEIIEITKGLRNLTIDSAETASVSGLMLQRDVGSFLLEQGTIYLCRPIMGEVRAALFVGSGMFVYAPPTEVEQGQLRRFMETESVQEEISSILFLFGDTTVKEISAGLTFAPAAIPAEAGRTLTASAERVFGRGGYTFEYEMWKLLLEGGGNDLFVAFMERPKKEPICFTINPYEAEEVMFLRTYDAGPAAGGKVLETVNQFHTQAEYATGIDPRERRDDFDVASYVLDCTIGDDLIFGARGEITIRPRATEPKWLRLDLFPLLDVDSLRWGSGAPAVFHYDHDQGHLWIRNDEKLDAEGKKRLRIGYHGEMIGRREEWLGLYSSTGWYPTHGYKQKSLFDLTFHVPTEYEFASIGDNLSTDESEGVTTSRWVTDRPIRNASFNIGLFKIHEVEKEGVPPITVMMSRSGHGNIGASLIEQGITSGRDMEKQVGEDVAQSLEFFTKIYGPLQCKKFNATEIPGSHGEAFPGLIHLSWSTFQRTGENGFDELFRAHEVAHQWWGIGLDFATYHDQWLSEGFAEYSGMLYMSLVRKDNEKFFNWLRTYRESIVKNRKSIFGSGQEAGPIWLGYRTQSIRTAGDYDLIIYRKGAWVLHMLRNLLMNETTLNDDAFLAIMKDFFTTYQGKEATTLDFQRTIEKRVGVDMGWFFDQWVRGTSIPTYRFAYKVRDTLDGKYKVSCSIRQLNVPDDFKMYVPIRITFKGGGMARSRVLITGPRTEIEIPQLMPKEPESIILNDLESVLCEVEPVDWDERME